MPRAVVLELVSTEGSPEVFSNQRVPLYLGKYAHGLFFTLLRHVDPDLSDRLHPSPRKPFTLSPLEKGPGKLLIRLTTLDDALFASFFRALLERSLGALSLGDAAYRLVRVLGTPQGHPLADFSSWEELRDAPPLREVTLIFQSPTVFTTSKAGGRTRFTPLPEPRLIVSSLLDKWQAHSPFPYNPREEAALREVFDLDLELKGFRNLRYHRVQAGKSFFPGFTGEVTLRLWSDSLEVQRALGRLAGLAPFSGVGAKTTYGMGLTLFRADTGDGRKTT